MAAEPSLPEVEKISPAKAKRMLGSNVHNRNLRPARVQVLAAAIQRGEWELNGETIKIAEDGTLLDGQHRLQAVVESGVSIRTVVVRGLPLEIQDTVDTGRRRRLADVLALEGHTDTHALAATLNVLHRYRTEHRLDANNQNAPTPQQALDLLADNPDVPKSVKVGRQVAKEIGGPIGVLAAFHQVFREVDLPAAESFFDRLEDGVELKATDPVLHLRRQIIRASVDRSYAARPPHIAALMIKAFNWRRSGKRIELLSYRKSEAFPVIDSQQDLGASGGR